MRGSLSVVAALAAAGIVSLASGQVIVAWDFEGETLNPSVGSGTAANVGGTSSAFASGSGGGRAWNTSAYQTQGAGSGIAGVSFFTSTVGFSDIEISFQHRASGTASRWAQVDYTLDGGANWVTGFWTNSGGLSPHDNFYSFTVDFGSVAGADDNANFGFRIVSIFSPFAFNQNSTLSYGADAAYMRANADANYDGTPGSGSGNYAATGTWRFDNVTVTGVPAPGAVALLGAAGLLGSRRRR